MEEITPEEDIKIINSLQNKLYEEAELLHDVSTSLKEDLDNNDTQAHEILKTALRHATHHFEEIGLELNGYGGYALMQESIQRISKAGFSIAVIDATWDGIGEWAGNNQKREDKVKYLQQQLLEHTQLLRKISADLQFDLHNNDKQAELKLKTAIDDAVNHYKQIGTQLNTYGGFDLMQSSAYKISKAGFTITVIEHAWNGIGEWMV